jgi:hypothetical protein
VISDRLRRAQAVAAAGERLAAAHGVVLPADLRLWALAGGRPTATPCAAGASTAAPDVDLAAALEAATSPRQRRSRGLHITPAWLADRLVGLVVDEVGERPASCDPACGGGAFLLAVARALHERGVPREQVVEEMLWGADIDPVGLAAAEAALAIWSGGAVPPPGRLVLGDPLLAGADLWPDRPPVGFDLVVGNPPFQNQLGKATARAAEARRDLRRVFGNAVRAYTDTAWLFLLLGCRLTRPGGRVVMVQPDSLAAARDAAAVREAVDALAWLEHLWVDDHQVFEAAVRVCAPVLRRNDGPGSRPGAAAPAEPGRWHDLLADATGIPPLRVSARGTLAERAATVAGFRDEYYGLADLVRDAARGDQAEAGEGRALVTVGSIDWGRLAWGRRPVRFAKQRWEAPVVDLARLEAQGTPAARRWVARTAVPKLLVATQTRVVEAAVDERGEWVPSVPVIVVVPHRPEDLWLLAAAVLSPAASVWLSRRSPGVALARGALKVAARDLADLPLPADTPAWDAAAAALRSFVRASAGGRPAVAALDAFAEAAAAAYGSPPEVVAWWRERLDGILAAGGPPSGGSGGGPGPEGEGLANPGSG